MCLWMMGSSVRDLACCVGWPSALVSGYGYAPIPDRQARSDCPSQATERSDERIVRRRDACLRRRHRRCPSTIRRQTRVDRFARAITASRRTGGAAGDQVIEFATTDSLSDPLGCRRGGNPRPPSPVMRTPSSRSSRTVRHFERVPWDRWGSRGWYEAPVLKALSPLLMFSLALNRCSAGARGS